MENRLQKYREFMARLDGTAATKALAEGMVVATPGITVADRIVSKAELELTASQVLVGGIGSGKTTQLLLAQERLNRMEEVTAFYIESLVQREDEPLHGGLLLVSFCKKVQDGVRSNVLEMPVANREALFTLEVNKLYDELKEATPAQRQHFIRQCVKTFCGQPTKKLFILFDSMDRLTSLEQMSEIAEEVRLFSEAGVSVVIVAPQRMMYGPHRAMLDRFDEVYHQPFIDLANGHDGRTFLFEVLRRRATEEILPDACCQALVDCSGGVLRDLIALCRAAGEHAYVTAKGPIEPTHVDAAADGFGRKKLLNLSREQLVTLQRVRQKGSFVQTSEQDLTLLLTGCILEHQKPNGAPRYQVHPTIRPLLEQIAEEE